MDVFSLGRLKAWDTMGKAAATDGPQDFFFLILFFLRFLRQKEEKWVTYIDGEEGKYEVLDARPFLMSLSLILGGLLLPTSHYDFPSLLQDTGVSIVFSNHQRQ